MAAVVRPSGIGEVKDIVVIAAARIDTLLWDEPLHPTEAERSREFYTHQQQHLLLQLPVQSVPPLAKRGTALAGRRRWSEGSIRCAPERRSSDTLNSNDAVQHSTSQ